MDENSLTALAEGVRSSLRSAGIAVSLSWVRQSLEYLSRKGPVTNDLRSVAAQVYTLFLDSDLHEVASAEGILPQNAQSIEFGMLSSSDAIAVLQIDELINVGSSAAFQNNHSAEDQQTEETKGPAAGNSRMLKLFMTDGVQQIIGLEVRPIPSLSLQLSPGTKIKLRATHTPMRRGTALLSPDCFMVLEGSVERLVGCTANPTTAQSAPAVSDKPHGYPSSHQTGAVMANQQSRMPPPLQRPEQQQQGLVVKGSHGQLIVNAANYSTSTSTPVIPSTVIHGTSSSSGSGNLSLIPSSVYGSERYPPPHVQTVSMPRSATNFNMKQSPPASSILNHPQHQQQQQHGRASDGVLDLSSPSTPQSLSPRASSSAVLMKVEMDVDDCRDGPGPGPVRDSSHPAIKSNPAPPSKQSPLFSSSICANPLLPTVASSQRPLIRVSMEEVAVMLSNTTGTGTGALLDGDFVVRGTAVNIRRFKATASEGYVVLLSMEEEEDDSQLQLQHAKAVVPASVCDDLCARYLQVSSAEYLSQLKAAGKEESKNIKTDFSLKFRDFKGSFRARLLRPSDERTNTGTATPLKSINSNNANSQGEGMSLLLLDFYEPG